MSEPLNRFARSLTQSSRPPTQGTSRFLAQGGGGGGGGGGGHFEIKEGHPDFLQIT